MTPLWRLEAAALARGFRERAFTPTQAVEACIARIEARDGAINAFVARSFATAREAAAASTQRWSRGEPLGPLDGVPMSVKDNLHVQGLRTTWGSRVHDDWPHAGDELPVAHLRAAGAVILGKTNLPEFAMQGFTANERFGVTRNPWNTALTPGGSSGGAAAAVAAGMGALALATDGGGSTRRPASHCGLVGLKFTERRVTRRGGLPEIFLDYETPGVMARTVAGVRAAMQVLLDTPRAEPSPQPLRILHVPRFADHPVDEGIEALTARAARQLEALGHRVDIAQRFDGAEEVNEGWSLLSAAGLASLGARDAAFARPDALGAAARSTLATGLELPAHQLLDLFAAVRRLRAAIGELFVGHDVLLTPATAALPWPIDRTHPEVIAGTPVGPRGHAVFTAFANAAGLPAIAVPCGLLQGLPAGIQLVGPSGSDELLVALASQFEHAHPWAHLWPEE